MSDTFGSLVDRTFREWLYPPDDQPTRTTLNASITDSASSLVYKTDLLTAEEELLLGPGTLIEIGQEQMLVGAVNDSTNTLSSLVRGANGTVAAAHSADAVITIRPPFTRKVVFDALATSLVALYPRLYRRRATTLTLATGHTEAPADAEVPESFVWLDGAYPRFPRVRLIDLPTLATGRALLCLDADANTTGTLIYRARFPRPTAESDLLDDDLGVLPEYHTAIIVKAVAHLVASRDLDPLTTEFMTRQLEAQFQGNAAQSGSRLREALLRYYEYLMAELSRNTEAVQMHNGWVRGS